jgi:hypothetical protein
MRRRAFTPIGLPVVTLYASVLCDWFGADAGRVLDGGFEPYPILAAKSRA